jgi:hypothetical protein
VNEIEGAAVRSITGGASITVVILRESGVSSIPEDFVILTLALWNTGSPACAGDDGL